MRSEITTSTPNAKGTAPINSGLNTPLTTPIHEPTRQLARAPPPPAIAPQERSIPDAEESFNFNSDDDAFFAAVDLGEGDLGMPIDFEEGTGAITLSEGSDTSWERQQQHSTTEQVQQQGSKYIPAVPTSVPRQQQSRSMQIQNQGRAPETIRTPSSIPNRPQQQQQQQQRVSALGHVPTAQSNDRQNHHLIQAATNSNIPSATSPTLQQQQQRTFPRHTPASRAYQNQNHNPSHTPSTNNNSTLSAVNASVKKTSPPSTGGFQFPPGMVCYNS
jgi:hypothetical protein